jgi:hypothetical protein
MASVRWKGLTPRDREYLVMRLNEARKVGDDGSPRFEGEPFFDDVVGVLESSLSFPEGFPEAEARRAVGAALFAEGEEAFDTEGLRLEAERYVTEFLNSEPKPYVLVGSVSARYFDGLGEKELCGCRLAFHRRVPEPFREGHRRAEGQVRGLVPGDYGPSSSFARRYTHVTVEAKGRSQTEAAARAQGALGVQRSIWNLALLNDRASPTGASAPLNHVLLGPVQSLHRPDGGAVPGAVWYEPDYAGPVRKRQSGRLESHWESVRKYETLSREGLAGSRYRPIVEEFLRDYTRILDGRDPEAAFLRLWGLLERLVGLKIGEKHSVVTERAAFLVRAELRGLQYLVLESLRRHRNSGVHEGILPSASRDLLRQLTRFVVLALEFHLNESLSLSGMEEAARFLSLPSEPGPLRERIRSLNDELRLTRKAMEMHGHDQREASDESAEANEPEEHNP